MSALAKLSDGIADLRVRVSSSAARTADAKSKSADKSAKGADDGECTTARPPPAKVPLALRDGTTHIPTRPTVELLESIGGLDRLVSLTSRFYPKMFRDKHLSKFVADENDPHAERLATWIAEKMSGKTYWSATLHQRPHDQPYDRSSAHFKAWHSPKREAHKYGQHFKLDDTVIWMRLMFWSVREEGLDTEPFFSWFVSFIAHFARVYERSAPPYARQAAEWSTKPENITQYEADGWLMKDVVNMR